MGCGFGGTYLSSKNQKKKEREREEGGRERKTIANMLSARKMFRQTERHAHHDDDTHTQIHTITEREGWGGAKNNKPVRILLQELMGIKYLGG